MGGRHLRQGYLAGRHVEGVWLCGAAGWLGCRQGSGTAGKDDEVQALPEHLQHSASEALSIVALKYGTEILRRNLNIIRENLATADRFFAKYPDLFANNRPQCDPVAFHKMNIETPIADFCERLLQKAGVLLLPADIYDYEGPFFRMGYGRRSFAENLWKFEEYIVDQKIV